jgi:GH15 family glucan-1,4-alpha-glucosidase
MKDSGIWEDRGEPRHYTHSKIMMWVALDRAGKLAEYIGKEDRWKESKEKIRKWVLENCVSNGYLTRFGGSVDIDSSILSAPLYGFISEKDELFLNTLSKKEKELKVGNFVKRYKSDFMGEAKHPFLLTTLWLVRVYVRLRRIEEAKEIISGIEQIAGSLHLVGEHVDLEKKEFTGNFPQVFVHAEIVNLIKEIEGVT